MGVASVAALAGGDVLLELAEEVDQHVGPGTWPGTVLAEGAQGSGRDL